MNADKTVTLTEAIAALVVAARALRDSGEPALAMKASALLRQTDMERQAARRTQSENY